MQIGVETSRAVENKRIFVVDDDEIIRAALQFMLHDENETHEIASLDLAFAKAAEWKPDLILLAGSIVRGAGVSVLSQNSGANRGRQDPGGGRFGQGRHRAAMPVVGRARRHRQAAHHRRGAGTRRCTFGPTRRLCDPSDRPQDALTPRRRALAQRVAPRRAGHAAARSIGIMRRAIRSRASSPARHASAAEASSVAPSRSAVSFATKLSSGVSMRTMFCSLRNRASLRVSGSGRTAK